MDYEEYKNFKQLIESPPKQTPSLVPPKLIIASISFDLYEQLKNISPLIEPFGKSSHPCKVILKTGEIKERAYIESVKNPVASECPSIFIQEVAKIEKAPNRLPVEIANQIYGAGESDREHFTFTLVFKDQSQQVYCTGYSLSFLPYPPGKTAQDILKVIPHQGRGVENVFRELSSDWCPYYGVEK